MAKQLTVRSILEARISTYQMLSRLYLREVDEEYLAVLKKMRCPINTGNANVDQGYRLFHSYLSGTWERTIDDLARDYLATFIGANTTGHSAAYPNESVHTSPDRLVMQDARDEVLALYKAAGLKSDESWTAGEDHIALELEYMAHMAKRALEASDAGNDAHCALLLMKQHHFLEDHLCAWVPLLADDMLKFAKTDFYRALAYLTRGFVEEDRAFLEEVLAEELDAERGVGQEDESGEDLQESADRAEAGEGMPEEDVGA